MRILTALLCSGVLMAPCWAQGVGVSTLTDQTAVNLTVYNMGRGLVKDVRKLNIPSGEGELRFMDVASQIIPQTVHVKSLTAADKFRVLEQNYEYDLINRSRLLDKYVGKKVKLLSWHEYQNTKEEAEATLVSNNDGEVYDIGGEIYLGHPGNVVLPALPESLIAKPTLTWMYANAQEGSQDVEVAYMTNGVTWSADYVLVVDKDDALGDLAGWVTLDNQSGATYKDARLKLVAGKPNVVHEQSRSSGKGMMRMDMVMASAPQFQEESFFEYHLYDLQRKTTIKDRQTKQISLLEAAGIALEKKFIVADNDVGYYWQPYDATQKVPVKVTISFRNSEASRVGMPLPAGVVRLYKQDKKGGQHFIGEDRINHTSKDEEVKLNIGDAFDVVAEKKQTSFRNTSNRTTESSWEVTLRNHKAEDIVVRVEQAFPGMTDWQVLTSSMEYKKQDAQVFTFDVPVAKNGEAVVTYVVQTTR